MNYAPITTEASTQILQELEHLRVETNDLADVSISSDCFPSRIAGARYMHDS
jgi:hypothetical protein